MLYRFLGLTQDTFWDFVVSCLYFGGWGSGCYLRTFINICLHWRASDELVSLLHLLHVEWAAAFAVEHAGVHVACVELHVAWTGAALLLLKWLLWLALLLRLHWLM